MFFCFLLKTNVSLEVTLSAGNVVTKTSNSSHCLTMNNQMTVKIFLSLTIITNKQKPIFPKHGLHNVLYPITVNVDVAGAGIKADVMFL